MIYTLGYNAWSRDDMAATLSRLGAWLVDIRYSPRSARPGFDRTELEADFPTYLWLQHLGNTAFKEGGAIRLLAPERGVEQVARLLETRPVILLCACRDIAHCHRRVAAELVAAATGLAVEHLTPAPPDRDERQGRLF